MMSVNIYILLQLFFLGLQPLCLGIHIMIIPKANFLNTTFKKNKHELRHQIYAEKLKVKSEIVNALRAPKNHKLGVLEFLLSLEDYPLACRNVDESIVAEIIEQLSNAGYCVNVTRHNNVEIKIIVDWRELI